MDMRAEGSLQCSRGREYSEQVVLVVGGGAGVGAGETHGGVYT